MDDTCGTCGEGRPFSDATFDDGRLGIRWTMWSCGHSVRQLLDPESAAAQGATPRRHAAVSV